MSAIKALSQHTGIEEGALELLLERGIKTVGDLQEAFVKSGRVPTVRCSECDRLRIKSRCHEVGGGFEMFICDRCI
ncbi:MAG: hypothetical protein ACW99U_19245 [Candidatus Thorarchaeota archaeon]|jgi:hypothetical protein